MLSKILKSKYDQSGFTLVEVLVVAGILTLIVAGSASYLISMQDAKVSSERIASVRQVHDRLSAAMNDNVSLRASWNADQSAFPGTFDCLKNSTNCPQTGGRFVLYQKTSTGLFALEGAVPTTQGFDLRGQACNTFDPVNGNDACPFRYIMSWIPVCPIATDCVNPVVDYTAQLEYRPSTSNLLPRTFRPSLFKIVVRQREFGLTGRKACEASKGTWTGPNDETGTCISNAKNSCPAYFPFMVGFDASGFPLCRGLQYTSCPQGQVLLGVRSNGTYICGPGCLDAGSSSGSMQWLDEP